MKPNAKLTALISIVSSVFISSVAVAAPFSSDVELSSSNASPKSFGTIYLPLSKLGGFPSYTVTCTIQSDRKAKQNEDLFYIEPHLSFSVDGQVVDSVRGIGTLTTQEVSILKIPGIKKFDNRLPSVDGMMHIYLDNLDDTDTIQIKNCYASVEK